MEAKKPQGWSKFAALAKRIVKVDKAKVDAAIAQKYDQSPRNPQKK